MKIRAIANGNEYEYDEDKARTLIATGLFEAIEASDEIKKNFAQAPMRKNR